MNRFLFRHFVVVLIFPVLNLLFLISFVPLKINQSNQILNLRWESIQMKTIEYNAFAAMFALYYFPKRDLKIFFSFVESVCLLGVRLITRFKLKT